MIIKYICDLGEHFLFCLDHSVEEEKKKSNQIQFLEQEDKCSENYSPKKTSSSSYPILSIIYICESIQ
ncbi:hypothetical protein QR98_0078970 [Sarcoptes scabiei]|uniref:Uncharacterized protein n=1 Tax=Sarcoptes scabiei TaxID=52283 RepID=A0A132AEJ5_SARSC|nr:hypothetical protein QR98_0078970 [Sarcoptes scabiei]